MRVLVLDGNQNQAVAAVRSLAWAGREVWAGECKSWSKAALSRFTQQSFQYPDPWNSAEGFVRAVADVAALEPGTLVLPMTEATTLPLSAHRDLLRAVGARFVLPAHEDLLRACDKDCTTRLAAQVGVAVPETTVVCDENEARRIVGSIRFPVVLKPRSSQEFSGVGKVRSTGRPRYASNKEEFFAAYRDIATRASAVLVQQYVRGEGAGYFALFSKGELRLEFAHRRIRDVHPTGSGSALRISMTPDPEIRRAALAILKALHWHGVAMVEFRKELERAPVFMEVNGRFWHSLPLACYAGADFPALLASMAEQGDVNRPAPYRTGVKCRWLVGDFRHLLEVWRGAPAGFPDHYPDRVRTLVELMKPERGIYHDLFRWDDPMPEIADWFHFSKTVWRERVLGQKL